MTVLILVDLQNDFMPGGVLPVPDGDAVVPVANSLVKLFDVVVATQDWHPRKHVSFASCHPGTTPGSMIDLAGFRQKLWPDHCVENTLGAELHADLSQNEITRIFRKGSDPSVDSYSAFFDSAHQKSTGLADFLHDHKTNELYFMGLATEYCVKFSVLDAVSLGFAVHVIEDGCCGIDSRVGDVEDAFTAMAVAGVNIISSQEVIRRFLRR